MAFSGSESSPARMQIACYVTLESPAPATMRPPMHPLLKRIAVNGLPTAAILAAVGVAYTQLAGMWLSGGSPVRGAAPASDPVAADLTYRVPAMMALWGFLFVAAGESLRHLLRRNRPVAKEEPQPDTAEVLLEQLM